MLYRGLECPLDEVPHFMYAKMPGDSVPQTQKLSALSDFPLEQGPYDNGQFLSVHSKAVLMTCSPSEVGQEYN